uniref:G-protein coupled receptors family 2 profile 2 domain-containing protein n=1 Tax=Maylandia zebra TaxID=106582 RepID=A0A3P9C4J4_9CICH
MESTLVFLLKSLTQLHLTQLSLPNTYFPLLTPRPRHFELQCVSWNYNQSKWTDEGCVWGGASKPDECTCNHLTSFAILMSRYPIKIPYMTEITYAGLSASVVSLVISLLIELIVWSKVVKTNTLHLRHTAHVNISLCLLVADCSFLASSQPKSISEIWCRIAALLKHFCYLAMFFWMLSLSTMLLHQAVFLFHKVGKKTYLRFSLILGYVCPFLIVFITFLTNNGGAQDAYFSLETCWLVYSGLLKGTIYTFILPVGIINGKFYLSTVTKYIYSSSVENLTMASPKTFANNGPHPFSRCEKGCGP